ncbi:MAG TPA: 30S ribosomal protein S6 [Desulfobacteraceae bacterium]|nr:30S ribosomal protein S6 [Desulfobacteraceae bacterium]
MRRYETIFIADPDLQEEAQKDLFKKFTNLIDQEKGILVDFDDWGSKKLAYPINKKPRGHYVCMTYGGTGELVKEMERLFRLDDRVMKFMTVLLEKDVSPEALNQEIEAAKEESQPEKEQVATEPEADADANAEPETSEETEEEN